MNVRVEFYGIVRQRAGAASVELELPADATLGQLLDWLGARYPGFAQECLDGQRLRKGYIANVDGRRFVTRGSDPLTHGATILMMSADAGG